MALLAPIKGRRGRHGHMKLENELCFSSAACSSAALALAVRGPGLRLRSSKLELAHARHGPPKASAAAQQDAGAALAEAALAQPAGPPSAPQRLDPPSVTRSAADAAAKHHRRATLFSPPSLLCPAPSIPLAATHGQQVPSLTGVAGAPAPHAAKKPMPPEEHRLRCRGLRQSDPPE